VLAATLERAIKKEPPVVTQIARASREQSLGDTPRRDVDHIGAKHRQQIFRPAAVMHRLVPRRIGEIDP
jgi:hypothetical protein